MHFLHRRAQWVSDVYCVKAINQAAVSDLLELCFYERSFSLALTLDSLCETSHQSCDITCSMQVDAWGAVSFVCQDVS